MCSYSCRTVPACTPGGTRHAPLAHRGGAWVDPEQGTRTAAGPPGGHVFCRTSRCIGRPRHSIRRARPSQWWRWWLAAALAHHGDIHHRLMSPQVALVVGGVVQTEEAGPHKPPQWPELSKFSDRAAHIMRTARARVTGGSWALRSSHCSPLRGPWQESPAEW